MEYAYCPWFWLVAPVLMFRTGMGRRNGKTPGMAPSLPIRSPSDAVNRRAHLRRLEKSEQQPLIGREKLAIARHRERRSHAGVFPQHFAA